MEIYVNALVKKFESDRATAVANLNAYLTNSAGIGDHPNLVGEMEKLLAEIATADGKLISLQSLITTDKPIDKTVAKSK
tara:strand:+ start:208 stop:444 length:237 start_codon:yes stop_codon:yes gene_type:complete